MMTHKLRDVPQHMFGNSKMDQSRNHSPDSGKETSTSLRVKTESELSPRSTATDASRTSLSNSDRFDHRERSLPSQFQSQVDSSYHLMLERQHHLQQQMQHQHQLAQQQSRHSPLQLPRQSLRSISPSQHLKNELARQKPSSLDIDQPAAKRQLCKYTKYQ